MGRAMPQWVARVKTLLGSQPDSVIDADQIEEHVAPAIRKFSADRPRIASTDYPGNGSSFDLALPAGWVHGFSTPQGVEYPLGERDPVFLDEQEWILYPTTTAPTNVRLRTTTPASGLTARLYYSAPWPIPDTAPATDLISDVDYEPVACLAASFAAMQLASKASSNKDGAITSAAAVDFEGEAERWRAIARDRLKTYRDHVGGTDGADGPAGGTTDWDALATFPETGRRFLFRWPRR